MKITAIEYVSLDRDTPGLPYKKIEGDLSTSALIGVTEFKRSNLLVLCETCSARPLKGYPFSGRIGLDPVEVCAPKPNEPRNCVKSR